MIGVPFHAGLAGFKKGVPAKNYKIFRILLHHCSVSKYFHEIKISIPADKSKRNKCPGPGLVFALKMA
jgi:hypothetical protein